MMTALIFGLIILALVSVMVLGKVERKFGVNMLRSENSAITEEQFRYIDGIMVRVAERAIVARKVFGSDVVGPIGYGKEQYRYTTLTQMGAAHISMRVEENFKATDKVITDTDIPMLANEFRIESRALEASRYPGAEPLEMVEAIEVARTVALLEDELLLIGNEAWNGLYNGANNTFVGATWATAGNCVASIRGILALMYADNMNGPFNLVLNPSQYLELSTNYIGSITSELGIVMDALRGGEIIVSATMPDGQAMVVQAPGSNFYTLVIGLDFTTEDWTIKKEATGFRGKETLAPIVKQGNAIGTITGI